MSYLKVSDAFCYICRGVLIEPVTVPCLHVFCFTCFEQSMQETSYSCPLCRRRISNWVRTAKKADKLINVDLWTKIKKQFKEQVNLKLRGEDDGLDEQLKLECPTPLKLSDAGEVAKEFSKLINDFNAERQKLLDAEELASRELITKLNEEEQSVLENLRLDNDRKIRADEELAKKLHEEINKKQDVPPSSKLVKSNQNGRIKTQKGPMDHFIKANKEVKEVKRKNGVQLLLQENKINRCTSTDSTDSIQPEMHHFKPIKVVPRTPPKRYPDGKVIEIEVTKVKPLKLLSSQKEISSYANKNDVESKKIHSPYSAFIGKVVNQLSDDNSSPRKRLRSSADDSDIGVLKEITLGENSDSNSVGITTDLDLKLSQTDSIKRNKNSPMTTGNSENKVRSIENNFVLPSKMFSFDPLQINQVGKNENSDLVRQFDTQDYLSGEPDIEDKLIEEQRKIEQLILQEKADRELALKLSQQWETNRYELRKKPNQRQIVSSKRKTRVHENNKVQQTLISTLIKTRRKNK